MADPTQKWYYDQIKRPDSIENAVDNFYLNLLPDYFKKRLGYGIEQESRPLPEITKQRSDFTIRFIRNGDLKKVVLMEDRRKDTESSIVEWEKALGQLTTYLKLIRAEAQQDSTQTLYASVNIGTYIRFYQLDAYKVECIDFPGTNGKAFELAADEESVRNYLEEWVRLTSH